VGYQWHEIAFSAAAVLGASTMFWPFVAWWYAVVRRTVARNIKVKAAITRAEQTKGPYFGIWYCFEYAGGKYTHNATLVNTKLTRKIAGKEWVLVYIDPDRNRSFISSLVCHEQESC